MDTSMPAWTNRKRESGALVFSIFQPAIVKRPVKNGGSGERGKRAQSAGGNGPPWKGRCSSVHSTSNSEASSLFENFPGKCMDVYLSVRAGDAFAVEADFLVAKYAQQTYGLDRAIVQNATDWKVAADLPAAGDHRIVTSFQKIKAKAVLLVGVEPLQEFGYPQIRDFARRALTILRDEKLTVEHVALTLHGAGYGLDEAEAFESEVAGLLDAVATGAFPSTLRMITIVEGNPGRAARLTDYLTKLVPFGRLSSARGRAMSDLPTSAQQALRSAGYGAAAKPHVFVAMPFAADFDDLYHYGIQETVNRAGYLCERADLSSFTGDVMDWVRSRISSSRLIIADLTGANPNVYLEVGFAWALRVPTVLLVEKTEDLRFDVRGQRVIEYKGSIRSLEQRLDAELQSLQLS
jgi:hypothetical protein